MNTSYDNKTKTITITGFEPLVNPVLYIDDASTQNLDTDNTYIFLSDGIFKLTVKESTNTITELGYFLVTDYSKDKNRVILVNSLDNRTFYTIPEQYTHNNKIIREIEFSFYSGNIERPLLLFKELKFKQC